MSDDFEREILRTVLAPDLAVVALHFRTDRMRGVKFRLLVGKEGDEEKWREPLDVHTANALLAMSRANR
jgi:hypothetical protein